MPIGENKMSRKTNFQVYGPFGRVISNHICDHDKELHHRALEEARKATKNYPGRAWIRQINL